MGDHLINIRVLVLFAFSKVGWVEMVWVIITICLENLFVPAIREVWTLLYFLADDNRCRSRSGRLGSSPSSEPIAIVWLLLYRVGQGHALALVE